MRAARILSTTAHVTSNPVLVLTAHGSADPRAAANTHAVAATIRRMRPGLEVIAAFCEQNSPNLVEVLRSVGDRAVVTPLLLADAYHARVDIPAMIAESGTKAGQTEVLGEDDQLVAVLRRRIAEAGVSRLDGVGVMVTAVGSSRAEANSRTATVAEQLVAHTNWTAATAFAAGPHPNLARVADELRDRGADRLVIAPWFLAHGRITDRVAGFAAAQGIPMAQPLGPHRLVAETVLDRFDTVCNVPAAA